MADRFELMRECEEMAMLHDIQKMENIEDVKIVAALLTQANFRLRGILIDHGMVVMDPQQPA